MRIIRNLIWFLLAFGLTVWAGVASAADKYFGMSASSAYNSTSATSTCQKYHEATGVTFTSISAAIPGANGMDYRCYGIKPPSTSTQQYGAAISMVCPAARPYFNGVINICVAEEPDPEPEPPGECFSSDAEHTGEWRVGTVSKGRTYSPVGDSGATDGNCCIRVTDVPSCHNYPKSSNPDAAYCTYKYVRIGGVCGSDADSHGPDNPGLPDPQRNDHPPTPSADGKCPKGTVNIGTNSDGIPICAGTGSDPKNKPPVPPKIESEKTDTSDDGTKTTTKTETTTNADGSKTTVTTVTITKPDGSKQTDQQKETTKAPNGTAGKDDSKQDDEKYDLCKQNPNLTICQNSTVAGKCGEISCTGDAIQCATLRAAAAMQCKQTEEAQALSDSASAKLGQSILNGADPMKSQIDDWMKGSEVDFSSPNIDQSSFLPSSCLSVRSFQAMGQTISVDFSRLCEYIAPLRFVMLAIAFILAYRIVSDSVIKS